MAGADVLTGYTDAMNQDVTIIYLEMLDAGQLRPKPCPEPVLTVTECLPMQGDLCRSLYQSVGGQWNWYERLDWSDGRWAKLAADESVRTWIARRQGSIAGYFELNRSGGDVEIKYFGLTPEFIGSGYGGYLLTEAIRQAWNWDAGRVWVHTCTLDHENALANYQARGMKIFKTETAKKNLEPSAEKTIVMRQSCRTEPILDSVRESGI